MIPEGISNDTNVKSLYETGSRLNSINQEVIKDQLKERKLEDSLSVLSLHKTNRIITMTVIEGLVIVVSGIYQIFSLRKILIDKNLY